MLRSLGLSSAVIALAFFSPPVLAAGEAPSPSAPIAGMVPEVTITATRRETPLLELPLSSSVYTADRLSAANAETPKDLTALSPAFGVVNSIGESFGQLLRVRGLATSGADIGLESSVSLTIDGVPLSRPNLAILDLQGVERVEFLRGPQGTIIGRNATAGAVNIVTARPGFDPAFEIGAGAGSFESWSIRARAEGAILGDSLAARFDGLMGGTDGYIKNLQTGAVFGGRDRRQIRAQLFYDSADFQLRVIADYLSHDGTINGPVYRVVGPTGLAVAALSGTPLIAHFDAADETQIDSDGSRVEQSEVSGLTLNGEWRTAVGALAVIGSLRDADAARSYDVDNSPADIANDPRDGEHFQNYTFEVRLQGERGPIDYLVGAFIGRELIASRDNFETGSDVEAYAFELSGGMLPLVTGLAKGDNFPIGTGVSDVFKQRTTDFAFFTHNIVSLTDDFAVTLGARYSNQEKSLAANLASNNPACSAALANFGSDLAGVPPALQGIVCIPNLDPRYDGSFADAMDESDWSGTLAATYRLSANISVFAQYGRGYKGGGYQFDRSGMNPLAPDLSQLAFQAETADSVEVGLRGLSNDEAWRFSAALFHTRFNDYQFSYFTGLNRRTENVPELTSRGFEIEAGVRPIAPVELLASVAYQEVVFGDSGFPANLVQLEGTTAPVAPRWIVVTAASFDEVVESLGLRLFGSVHTRWQSSADVGASATPSAAFGQESYAVVGARAGVAEGSGRWRLEAWGRNIFDKRAWSILNSTTLQPGSISGYVTDSRVLGVTGTVSW